MSENNELRTSGQADTAGEPEAPALEEEDSGIIFIPDYGPDDTDAHEEQQKLFEQIQERESNTQEYIPPERNFWEKIGDFWFRNKALIIVAAAAIALVIYFTIVSIPEAFDGDVTLYVSSSDYRVSVTYEVQNELQKYVSDVNNDGEKKMDVADFNTAGDNGFIVMANYVLMQDQLSGKPLSMLWVVDKDLFDMMVAAYGEDIFESFEGAPLWIELTSNELINSCVEIGESPRLGICLRRMTDEFREDKKLLASYESALQTLANMKEAHPEMFEPAEENAAE